jgi:hypothetical protein
MDRSDILAAVKRLLEMYPGVVIDRLSGNERIVLRVTDLVSLARLTYCSFASNVESHVWSENPDPSGLRLDLRIPEEKDVEDSWPSLRILGAYLLCNLAGRGEIELGEANRLLAAWNFATVEEHFGSGDGRS